MADDDDLTAGEVLAGLTIAPVPEGWTPIDAVVLIKCLDDEGAPRWALRTTTGINDEELLGALVVRTDLLRRDMVAAFVDD